jgi:hypothetical protein
MEDALNFSGKGRKTQFYRKWQTTPIFSKWKTTPTFKEKEDNLRK